MRRMRATYVENEDEGTWSGLGAGYVHPARCTCSSRFSVANAAVSSTAPTSSALSSFCSTPFFPLPSRSFFFASEAAAPLVVTARQGPTSGLAAESSSALQQDGQV